MNSSLLFSLLSFCFLLETNLAAYVDELKPDVNCRAVLTRKSTEREKDPSLLHKVTTSNEIDYKKATSIYDFIVKDTYMEEISLGEYCRGYVTIIVNIASLCIVSRREYEQWTEIYKEFDGKIRLLSFPCNQFLNQTPFGDGDEMLCHLKSRNAAPGAIMAKAPEPVESWAPTVLDAFEHGKVCIPFGMFLVKDLPKSEDCLTLNIYVPANVKPTDKLAVLFFIHGGAFNDGSSDDLWYGPDFIVEKETILVTTNYRLGVLGFLSLDTPEYSGNMGLKDQQLALKWISENIERFGGDRKRITVFGNSAGGASTHYQMLSAESRKYFRNAIPMSGTVDNYWASSNADHSKLAFDIAKDLGEPQKTREQLIAFLKSVPATKLSHFGPIFPVDNALFEIPFGPIVERKDVVRPFLVEAPKTIYEKSNIETDAMFILASQETISVIPKPTATVLEQLNDKFNVPLPFKHLNIPVDSKEHRNLMYSVRKFYFGDAPISENTLPNLFDYLSDVNFVVNGDRSVKMHATHANGKAYYVWFAVDSILNAFKNLEIFKGFEMHRLPGAAHGDEICYLFRCDYAQELYDKVLKNKNDEQSKISLRSIDYLTTLFTNFAKYSEPTHNNSPIEGFKPVEKNNIHFLHISNDGLKTDSQPRSKAIHFWKNIEEQAARVFADHRGEQRDEL